MQNQVKINDVVQITNRRTDLRRNKLWVVKKVIHSNGHTIITIKTTTKVDQKNGVHVRVTETKTVHDDEVVVVD